MRKYFSFFKLVFKNELSKMYDSIGTIFGFSVHITIFCLLWEFVLGTKTMAGYTKEMLIWYAIFGEAIIYSYHNYFKNVSMQVENGDIAYDMSKPYNYILKIISEGLGLLPLTTIFFFVGSIIGVIFARNIDISLMAVICSIPVVFIACLLLLCIHIIIGLCALWVGKDTSSIWLIVQKFMLIFAFTPLELMPKALRVPLLFLPTTHIIYTPSKLLVDFSLKRLEISLVYELGCILLLGICFYIIYKKGVKKLNVNGI